MGVLSERQFAEAIAQRWGVPYTELSEEGIDPEAARLVPGTLAQRHTLIAIARRQDRLVVAMSDPSNVVAIDDIRLLTGLETEIVVASPDSITRAQSRQYGIAADLEQLFKTAAPSVDSEVLESRAPDEEITVAHLRSIVETAPIVRIVNQVIQQAIQAGASDIHLEPRRRDVKVRFRIDGLLRDIMTPPKEMQAALVSRVKILASLDIAERRVPQDGQIHMRVDGKVYDFRVSTLPTVLGENIVIRVLDQSSTKGSLNQLGLPGNLLATWET
jgi:type IV pilus assembly protein PilB